MSLTVEVVRSRPAARTSPGAALAVRCVQPDEQWDGFERHCAHPANSPSFALVHRRWRCSPLFIEAACHGRRMGQWLVFRAGGWWGLRRPTLFALAAPHVRGDDPELRTRVFVAMSDWLATRFRPQTMTLQSFALVRGISEQAYHEAGFRRIEKFWSYVNRTGDDDFLLSTFGSNHRTNTRKALKLGYSWRADVTADEFVRLSRETYGSPDSGPAAQLIHRIQQHMVPAGTAVISGVTVEGSLRAASIVLFAGNTGYYLHGGSTSAKDRNAATYLHYENMRWLHRRGIAEYDFGGAKVGEGHSDKALSISEFKRKFGGRLIEAWGGSWR